MKYLFGSLVVLSVTAIAVYSLKSKSTERLFVPPFVYRDDIFEVQDDPYLKLLSESVPWQKYQ